MGVCLDPEKYGSSNMKLLSVISFAALTGVSAVTLVATNASAAIVCNADGDCWHTQTDYQYQPTFGLVVHQNDWKWKEGDKHAWREHDGKGYWKGGSWQTF
jgi:hypothetical protein